jgi:hypothetical protein
MAATLSVAIVSSLGWGNDAPTKAASPLHQPPPAVLTIGLSAHWKGLLEWGLGLYADAGLDLPPIVVEGHDDAEPCWGRRGAAEPRDGVVWVHLCGAEPSSADEAEPSSADEFLMLNELAHAWDRHQLTEERRQALLELRGLELWRDSEWHDVDWHDRGAEHAAEIMAWGLMDRPIKLVRIDQNSCGELEAAYRVLTGDAPLHGYTKYCD